MARIDGPRFLRAFKCLVIDVQRALEEYDSEMGQILKGGKSLSELMQWIRENKPAIKGSVYSVATMIDWVNEARDCGVEGIHLDEEINGGKADRTVSMDVDTNEPSHEVKSVTESSIVSVSVNNAKSDDRKETHQLPPNVKTAPKSDCVVDKWIESYNKFKTILLKYNGIDGLFAASINKTLSSEEAAILEWSEEHCRPYRKDENGKYLLTTEHMQLLRALVKQNLWAWPGSKSTVSQTIKNPASRAIVSPVVESGASSNAIPKSTAAPHKNKPSASASNSNSNTERNSSNATKELDKPLNCQSSSSSQQQLPAAILTIPDSMKSHKKKELAKIKSKFAKYRYSSEQKIEMTQWLEFYSILLDYKAVHGNYQIPLGYVARTTDGVEHALGVWFKDQLDMINVYADVRPQYYNALTDIICEDPELMNNVTENNKDSRASSSSSSSNHPLEERVEKDGFRDIFDGFNSAEEMMLMDDHFDLGSDSFQLQHSSDESEYEGSSRSRLNSKSATVSATNATTNSRTNSKTGSKAKGSSDGDSQHGVKRKRPEKEDEKSSLTDPLKSKRMESSVTSSSPKPLRNESSQLKPHSQSGTRDVIPGNKSSELSLRVGDVNKANTSANSVKEKDKAQSPVVVAHLESVPSQSSAAALTSSPILDTSKIPECSKPFVHLSTMIDQTLLVTASETSESEESKRYSLKNKKLFSDMGLSMPLPSPSLTARGQASSANGPIEENSVLASTPVPMLTPTQRSAPIDDSAFHVEGTKTISAIAASNPALVPESPAATATILVPSALAPVVSQDSASSPLQDLAKSIVQNNSAAGNGTTTASMPEIKSEAPSVTLVPETFVAIAYNENFSDNNTETEENNDTEAALQDSAMNIIIGIGAVISGDPFAHPDSEEEIQVQLLIPQNSHDVFRTCYKEAGDDAIIVAMPAANILLPDLRMECDARRKEFPLRLTRTSQTELQKCMQKFGNLGPET